MCLPAFSLQPARSGKMTVSLKMVMLLLLLLLLQDCCIAALAHPSLCSPDLLAIAAAALLPRLQ